MSRDVFAPRPGFHWLRGSVRPETNEFGGGQPGVYFRNVFGRWFDIDSAYDPTDVQVYDTSDVEVRLVAEDDRDIKPHYIGPVTPP